MKTLHLMAFGGPLLKNSNAKGARSLHASTWIQIVLHSSNCDFSSVQRLSRAQKLLKKTASGNGIKICDISADGKKLHFSIQLRRKRHFRPFIRSVTGSLALLFSGASKNRPLKTKFWAYRPWTCVLKKLKALFGPQSENHFVVHFELAELLRSGRSHGSLALGP